MITVLSMALAAMLGVLFGQYITKLRHGKGKGTPLLSPTIPDELFQKILHLSGEIETLCESPELLDNLTTLEDLHTQAIDVQDKVTPILRSGNISSSDIGMSLRFTSVIRLTEVILTHLLYDRGDQSNQNVADTNTPPTHYKGACIVRDTPVIDTGELSDEEFAKKFFPPVTETDLLKTWLTTPISDLTIWLLSTQPITSPTCYTLTVEANDMSPVIVTSITPPNETFERIAERMMEDLVVQYPHDHHRLKLLTLLSNVGVVDFYRSLLQRTPLVKTDLLTVTISLTTDVAPLLERGIFRDTSLDIQSKDGR